MVVLTKQVRWRATGPYLTILTSKAGLLEETKLFLGRFGELGDISKARQLLIDGGLPQSSRVTRTKILDMIYVRLVRWQPPTWVLNDLATFAMAEHTESLKAALILHLARQDTLVYDFTQKVIFPGWQTGDFNLTTASVQHFLDSQQETHPEAAGWSNSTRERLSQHLLSALRDFGLLEGKVTKHIVEPVVPPEVIKHLIKLLKEEGVEDIINHPDWRLWLWDTARVVTVLKTIEVKNG